MKEKKKNGLKITLLTILILVAAILAGTGYFLYQKANSGLFFEETKINGYDVSGMTPKEVLLILEKDYSAPTVTITENGETAQVLTLAELGYEINETKLLSNIQAAMREQNIGLIFSLLDGNEFEVDVPFDFDESVFKSSVTYANFAKPRQKSSNAELKYNETENYYYIEPEEYGTEFDDADLQVLVKDYTEKLVEEDRPAQNAEIAFPSSFYFLPEVTKDDPKMNETMNIYNSFCKADVTITFGEEKVNLKWDTIQTWLSIENGQGVLDDESIYNFVYNLAAKYNTLYLQRTFTTTEGKTVTFESSDYGYQINQDAEAQQLIADIRSNTTVEREPVYYRSGYKRNGTDDLAGCYVEIDLTKQHLWFYMDGKLVIETDFVSGLPKDERETVTGVFPLAYKESPSILTGGQGNGAYETEVQYWMPFHDGQGLHDADWRSTFGGNIYQTNGSHGCVNLPPAAAKTIYENIDAGVAIILYKS